MQDTDTNKPALVDIGVEHGGCEFHDGRRERVVGREGQAAGEDSVLEGRVEGACEQAFPVEEVVFGYGAGGYSVGGGEGEGSVFGEEAAGGEGGCHGSLVLFCSFLSFLFGVLGGAMGRGLFGRTM